MNETSESPVSGNPSATTASFNPIIEGMKKGALASLTLSALYALAVPLLFAVLNQSSPLTTPATLQDGGAVFSAVAENYGNVLLLSGLAFVVGVVPALIFGLIGGGIIGAICYGINRRLPTIQAIGYGFWISLAIVAVRIILLVWSEGYPGVGDWQDPFFGVIVVGPLIGAFFGFWWVVVKVNERMPID
jgi:hypothetical protein